jgi:hypothetical protein
MSDITVMSVDQFDSPNGGGFCRARAGLGVSAFGMQVEHFPPNFEHFPEHDHTADGQEEVYTALWCRHPARRGRAARARAGHLRSRGPRRHAPHHHR